MQQQANPRENPGSTLAELALITLVEQRALDPVGYLVTPKCSFADVIIIGSATSARHAQGIADNVIKTLKESLEAPRAVSGYETGEWILIDYSDVLVHIFYEPMRHFYNLDELWGKSSRRLELDPILTQQMKKLRTGMY